MGRPPNTMVGETLCNISFMSLIIDNQCGFLLPELFTAYKKDRPGGKTVTADHEVAA